MQNIEISKSRSPWLSVSYDPVSFTPKYETIENTEDQSDEDIDHQLNCLKVNDSFLKQILENPT
jgi:hypothetical protein